MEGNITVERVLFSSHSSSAATAQFFYNFSVKQQLRFSRRNNNNKNQYINKNPKCMKNNDYYLTRFSSTLEVSVRAINWIVNIDFPYQQYKTFNVAMSVRILVYVPSMSL